MESNMKLPIWRAVVVAVFTTSCSSVAIACSCDNNVPIQRTYERYAERAVFTARVVRLMGNVYKIDGGRSSDKVLAVVDHRYWGLPWYWPKAVVLDGSYPCDIALGDGEIYLVSGRLRFYGVLEVNGCSRTQPLKSAQIDIRTLDGSNCASPGGTIIGRLFQAKKERVPVRNAPLTFQDSRGKTYTTQSDADGIYEFRHLPPGPYTLASRPDQVRHMYIGDESVIVMSGVCSEPPAVYAAP